MKGDSKAAVRKRRQHVERDAVGVAEFRGNLAKYLKAAGTGQRIVVEGRGGDAYLLIRLDEEPSSSILGCMRDRTDCASGAIVNARERWVAGEMP